MTGELFPYQAPELPKLTAAITKHVAALDASDTGTGKTFMACAAAAALGLRPAILCPQPVIPAWRRICATFDADPIFVTNYEQAKTKKFEHGMLETTYKGSRKIQKFNWSFPAGSLLIFDECHRCKNQSSQNAKLMRAAKLQDIPTLCLSATAAEDPTDMYALGYLLGLHKGADYYPWLFRHGCRITKFGIQFVGDRSIMNRLHEQIFPEKGIRIRIADLGDQFPETQIIAEAYDTGDLSEIQKVYQEMQVELDELNAAQATDKKTRRARAIVIQLRARQKVELMKVPLICDMVNDAYMEGKSIVIFTNFRQTQEAIFYRVGRESVQIHGEQSPDERQDAIDRFQAGQVRVIICGIKSGGVGLSLHGKGRVAIICPTWSAVDLKQTLGRVHRAGGERSIQRIVYAAGTIEERICEKVRDKLKMIYTLNDGDLHDSTEPIFEETLT